LANASVLSAGGMTKAATSTCLLAHHFIASAIAKQRPKLNLQNSKMKTKGS